MIARNRAPWLLLMGLGWLMPAMAQVIVGDNANISAGGSLSVGYNGAFRSSDVSTHSLDFGGYGQIHGFYYDPRFLSFDLRPYYRRTQDNSIYQNITNGSGFVGSTNFFSGSHFPGAISYSKQYDTTGQFGIPGISGITSHGNGSSFGITWSALLPDKPSLTASFTTGGGTSSVFGTNTESHSSSRTFSLASAYRLAGFDLQAQYMRLSMDATFPAFLQGSNAQDSSTATNTFSFNSGHALPWRGYWGFGWNHSSYDGEYRAGNVTGWNDGSGNVLNSSASFNPTRKLGVVFGGDYNDNLYGSLQQQLLQAGGTALLPKQTASSSAAGVYGQASYSLTSHIALFARANSRELWVPEGTRRFTQFSGNATFNYALRLLGTMTFSVGLIDTATQQGHSGTSLVGNLNMIRRLHGWELGGNFVYTQQVQTLADVYTTSLYSYGASAKRRFRDLYWTSTFNGSHSGLTQFQGFSSRTESFSSALSYRRYSISGHYSQSMGTSILTPTGLIPLPPGVPPPAVLQPILYNGKSYGAGLGMSPFRRVILSANYAKANSSTTGTILVSAFDSTILNARLQYDLRKLKFDANFTRFEQSITTGTLPAVVNSYYFRVSRWFNVF